MVHAIRLLGKDPFDAADDRQVLEIIVACFALDPERRDPFAVLRERTDRPEEALFEERLLGRLLCQARPGSKEAAREVLLGVVDAAVERLEALEQGHRQREARRVEALAYDDSPEGEWVRRQQSKSTRAIFRILEQFRKARRRGEPLLPPPPPTIEPGPADAPVSIAQEGRRPLCDGPRPEVLGAERTQVEERTSDLDFRRYPYTPKPMSPARRESIIRRMFQSMGSLALLLPFVLAGGPGEDSARPERRGDSGRFAQPMIEDGSPVGSIPCLMGQDWLSDPLEVVFHPRNQQNEPKDGGFSPVLPARTRSLADRSRGPPGSGIDLAAADRRSSEPGKTGRSGTRAPWERMVDQTGHVH